MTFKVKCVIVNNMDNGFYTDDVSDFYFVLGYNLEFGFVTIVGVKGFVVRNRILNMPYFTLYGDSPVKLCNIKSVDKLKRLYGVKV